MRLEPQLMPLNDLSQEIVNTVRCQPNVISKDMIVASPEQVATAMKSLASVISYKIVDNIIVDNSPESIGVMLGFIESVSKLLKGVVEEK
jgi:hypothetical protein